MDPPGQGLLYRSYAVSHLPTVILTASAGDLDHTVNIPDRNLLKQV